MSAVKEAIQKNTVPEAPVTGITEKTETHDTNTNGDVQLPSSGPTPQSPQAVNIHSQPGYYGYPNQVAPNSPSSTSLGNGGYGIQSLLAQQAAGNAPFSRQYNNVPPLSPALRDTNSADVNNNLPPASPLFPGAVPLYSTSSEQLDSNMMNGASMFASTTTPTFQYLSGPPPSPVVSYGYPPSIPNSPEARTSWPDRNLQQQHLYNPAPTTSPHIHGVPMQYQGNVSQTRRTTSFDGELLPPSAIDDNSSAMFTTGGTLFSQQPWAPPPELYNSSPSSLQQHLSQQISSPPRVGMHGREQPIPGAHGHPYFPAATPGPPIQTTQNNKGPDGANLFIFHIPNHFTNLDMWHLFCHYGNLLSVRIMVEKDTGRSRGFGFVSYDSPDAAAMAIKELNGFVIGNKRLKVQHKQIRPSDNNPAQQHQHETSVGPPPSYQDGNTSVNQQSGNWTGNETSERRPIVSNSKDSQPPPIPDVTETSNGSSEKVGSTLSNLESIRDALPEVQ